MALTCKILLYLVRKNDLYFPLKEGEGMEEIYAILLTTLVLYKKGN